MKKRWLIAIIVTYIVVRTYIATLSSYGFYHGWNEGWYSLIAKNYFSGSLWEQVAYSGGEPFNATPPLFSYAVYASFKVFGISDISARLVSILSEVIAVLGVYILAKELYNEKTASIAAVIFIFIPWDILWFGRAQTDPLMTALMTLSIALYVHAYKNNKSMLPFGITLGLAVFTKQPALAALPVVLLWSYFQGIRKKQIIDSILCFFAGMIPLMVWLSHYLVNGNTAFVSHIIYGELAYRSEPFSDLERVALFTSAGISPLVILGAAYQLFSERGSKNILVIWLLTYGAFVLIRTPQSHEYYSLPLMAPVAIMFGAFIEGATQYHKKWNVFLIVLISTLPFTYMLLSYSGDMGYTGTKKMSEYVESYESDAFLFVHEKYTPQIEWYSKVVKIYAISGQSLEEIEGIAKKENRTALLLIDSNDFRQHKAKEKYEVIRIEAYDILLPSQQNIPGTLILYKMS